MSKASLPHVKSLIVCGALAAAPGAQALSFSDQTRYALPDVSGGPRTMSDADLNNDGRVDLIAAENATLMVLLSNGDGSFTAPVSYPAGGEIDGVAAADLDGDGDIDLAAPSRGSTAIDVLYNNGDGTFAAPVTETAGHTSKAVASGDFDGDGLPDLAVVSYHDSVVTLLIKTGAGFDTPVDYAVGFRPTAIAAEDLDGDHRPDLVVTNSGNSAANGSISVLLNDGTGAFGAATEFVMPLQPESVITDLDGDGDLDVAVATPRKVQLLTNAGDGSFTPTTAYDLPWHNTPLGIAAADVDGDGDNDLLGGNASTGVAVLFNDGGSFGGAMTYAVGAITPGATVAKDFDGDGRVDLAVADFQDKSVSIALNVTDLDPEPISFIDQNGVLPGDVRVSNAVTIAGLGSTDFLPISLTAGKYRINGGTFTSAPGMIGNDDVLEVRLTASPQLATAASTTVTVGTTTATFAVTTVAAISGDDPTGGSSNQTGGGGAFGWLLLALAGLTAFDRRRIVA